MKANRSQIERALARPADTRLFLLHGPDESGSRGLARALAAAMGADAERIDLTGAELKADPARLADEAAAISMFGGARWILVEQAGDDCVAARVRPGLVSADVEKRPQVAGESRIIVNDRDRTYPDFFPAGVAS